MDTEHKCLEIDESDELYQNIIIIYMEPDYGWFLWFDYPDGSNCQIIHCPFCGIKLIDIE